MKNNCSQAPTKKDGGTRQVQIQKDVSQKDILSIAQYLIVPEGNSTKGLLDDIECDLTNFKLDQVDDSQTIIIAVVINTKLYKFRFYLK